MDGKGWLAKAETVQHVPFIHFFAVINVYCVLKGYSGGRDIDIRLYLHPNGAHRLEETDKQTEYRKMV